MEIMLVLELLEMVTAEVSLLNQQMFLQQLVQMQQKFFGLQR
jgi:hypothetical protein